MAIIECKVDQNGVPTGFTCDQEIAEYGIGLEGATVTLDSGDRGTVVTVYSHIQTRQSAANWVAVDVETHT